MNDKHKEDSVWEVEEYWPESETFNGKPIVDIDSNELIDPSAVALLVSQPLSDPFLDDPDPVVFDEKDTYQYLYDSAISPAVVKVFHNLISYKELSRVDTLVIGPWGGRHTDSTDMKSFIELMSEHKAKFSGLKALFVGGAPLQWMGIHDIQLYQLGRLLNDFSQLEYFKVRGAPNEPNQGDMLHHLRIPDERKTFFEEPIHHPNLKKLVIETADMDLQTIENLTKSQLPKLEHLELWFGAFRNVNLEEYYQHKLPKSIGVLLKKDFPLLRYLGLRNSSQADKMVEIVLDSPIIAQLDELDLSLGNLTDKGAKMLLKSPQVRSLKKLNIYHHAIKSIRVCEMLAKKIPEVDYRLNTWMNDGEDRFDDKDSYNIFMHE